MKNITISLGGLSAKELNSKGYKVGMVFIRSDGTTKFIPIDPEDPFKAEVIEEPKGDK